MIHEVGANVDLADGLTRLDEARYMPVLARLVSIFLISDSGALDILPLLTMARLAHAHCCPFPTRA